MEQLKEQLGFISNMQYIREHFKQEHSEGKTDKEIIQEIVNGMVEHYGHEKLMQM